MPKNPSAPVLKKTKNTNKPPAKTVRKAAAPGALSGLTPAQVAVLQRLSAQAGMSTAEVAAAEVMGHSTVQKALTVLEAAGLARREAGVRNGALKSPDRWFTVTSATSLGPEPAPDAPRAAIDTDVPEDAKAVDDAVVSEPDPESTAAGSADPAADTPPTDWTNQGTGTPADSATAEPEESGDAGQAEGAEVVPDTADIPDADTTENLAAVTEPDDSSDTASGLTAGTSDQALDEAVAEQSAASASAPAVESTAPGATDSSNTAGPEPVPAGSASQTSPQPAVATPASASPKPKAVPDPQQRLGKGELYELVKAHLATQPGESFTATAIGKALGRSSGAVSNCLDKLIEQDFAVQTSNTPRKVALASPPTWRPGPD